MTFLGTNNLYINCSSAKMHHLMNKMKINAWIKLSIPNFLTRFSILPILQSTRNTNPMSLLPLVATLHNYIKLNSSSLSSPDTLPHFISWNPQLLVKMNDFWSICCCQISVSVKVPWLIFSLKYSLCVLYRSHLFCPSPNGWCSS